MSIKQSLMNAASRRLENLFPGYFGDTKHNYAADFGYPEHLSFNHFYQKYTRNSLAKAGVNKTAKKCWQDMPYVLEKQKQPDDAETEQERLIRRRFEKLRVWQNLCLADARSLVGGYSGVILRLADDQTFDKPVSRVPGGLNGLVGLIPAWKGQLTVSDWDYDETSETYGEPKMFQFQEASLDRAGETNPQRTVNVHPDRVIVWSEDGTVHAPSLLEAGYNNLIDLEKVVGAGGEGFWKNAKSGLVLELDKDADATKLAKGMGVEPGEVADKIGEAVDDFNKGFDKTFLAQGIKVTTVPVNLPSPEHFKQGPLELFAASIEIPLKILIGSQSGERASTEDAQEWAKTCMSRRDSVVIPNLMAFIDRLERFGILPERDWLIDWADLTESSITEKTDRASKMTDMNEKHSHTTNGALLFTDDEIRGTVDYAPLTPDQLNDFNDDPADADEAGEEPIDDISDE
ncbi:anti-CBASS protein Acb1 family protein [Litorimonas haliclonae]|uniref:anti-CBASS protein Acb1 family protein n=1 Tax=Litorimonas haliclonae TaxID=2081977 RepID=UPI0039EE0BC8